MIDEPIPHHTITQASTQQSNGILDQTLGDVLQNNPRAQQMIMQSMGISQEKFQEMLGSAKQNNMMDMKIGDLFNNGIVQQAVMQQNDSGQQMQVTPEQLQQLQNGTLSPEELLQVQQVPQKISFFDKVKSWFK